MLACPYGAITRDSSEKKVAAKCDLCGGKETPSCVEHCPNGALTIEDRGGK
ncbi:MAG: 4Fe-4S dicluster domain-containing protein [Bacillota bacterium]|nr:4Fe-4S dicluster domain-containing protein [Bacillota bacterium]